MAKKKNVNKDLSTAQKVGLGVGLTAAAVAAAGTYFLYGSRNAKDNRKKVKSWMLKARAEVLEALEKAEHITEEEYHALVEAIGGAYGKVQNATSGEIKDFKKEMKDHWGKIERSGVMKKVSTAAKGARKKVKKAARRAVGKKRAVKKVTKKTAKKATRKRA
jgi:hypothetical protein